MKIQFKLVREFFARTPSFTNLSQLVRINKYITKTTTCDITMTAPAKTLQTASNRIATKCHNQTSGE